jgi:ABC-2 type transport system permease protein
VGVFLLGSLLYILCGLGLGLFVSTISSTQREAFLATFLIFLPTILLSGFMFPVSSMPEVFQWATLGNPMRHYLVIVRGLFLKGAGWAGVGPSLAFLAVLGVGMLAVSAGRFRRGGS